MEEDLEFVTSLPSTKNKSLRSDGRSKKRSLQAARKDPADHSMSSPRWTIGKQRDSDLIGGEDRPSSRQRRGDNQPVFVPGTDRSSTDLWVTATAGGLIDRGQPNPWGSLDTIGSRECSYRRHDSDQHPKPAPRRQGDSRTNSAGSRGVDAASSRWSNFIG